MESFTILKYKIHFLCFFFLFVFKLNAQVVHNYQNISIQSNQNIKNKIESIINSKNIFLVDSNSLSRIRYANTEIIDIRYNNLNQLSLVDTTQLQNLKYCILRIQSIPNPIDLNQLNTLTNLEVIHIIIETDFLENPSFINLINQNIIITYVISIPQ
ncbi:hypothetical protein GFJ94_03530 [Flavobacterium sp. LMO8]|uniref:hypothetical protein n=1 Tax=Flavobacterium sp. LMO8 TaxID=2654244 RepID=UPI001290D159|nr:hypothetical protein [Flavobacterium sp. LMO8]MQP24132.1 hypothetical protein [Flavobacterium sp. LMO8]